MVWRFCAMSEVEPHWEKAYAEVVSLLGLEPDRLLMYVGQKQS